MPQLEGGSTLVQYVFLDVVRFTQGRTIEAQVDIVTNLNAIVLAALEDLGATQERRILLPTGDGLAIALLQPAPFDLGLTLATSILKPLYSYNQTTKDDRRRFEVRIGVNQNIDNLLVDINGRMNVAGRGINQAQRIMAQADGRQILIGGSIHEVLCEREAYGEYFRALQGRDKHGNSFTVHQVVHPQEEWLNVDLPSRFQAAPLSQLSRELTDYAAHFIANSFAAQSFLQEHVHEDSFFYQSAVLIHLLTADSLSNSRKSPFEERICRVDRAPDGTPSPTWNSISDSDFWVNAELASAIEERLRYCSECFEEGTARILLAYPTAKGVERVKSERPEVWSFVVGPTGVLGKKNQDG